MKLNTPLVTIGIPTYNRSAMLKRSIESALSQNYSAIEVIISDNASTDDTQDICQKFTRKDDRVTYFKQPTNIGAAANFSEVLKRASGEYFMWLGDDDWIDATYVNNCISVLIDDPSMALASGAPIYYQDGKKHHDGRIFDLLEGSWFVRVVRYYAKVADNGMFYGIMRTVLIQSVEIPNTMGGDWHLIANIVSTGKTKMLTSVVVHRELGGATASYQKIAKSMGLPRIQAIFPMLTIAAGAWMSIVASGAAYKRRGALERIFLAGMVVLLTATRPIRGYLGRGRRLFERVSLVVNKWASLRMDKRL